MTQASLLRHYNPQLMLGFSTAEAAAALGGEIAFLMTLQFISIAV